MHLATDHIPRSLLALSVTVKLLLARLLIFSLAASDLPQFAGKAMTVRALTYPRPALLVPATLLRGRSYVNPMLFGPRLHERPESAPGQSSPGG